MKNANIASVIQLKLYFWIPACAGMTARYQNLRSTQK